MSVEDVSSAGVVVDSKSKPCDTHCQDGIVLVQMASLSIHTFAPADFKGKFRKIQPRKRPTIIKEGDSSITITFSPFHLGVATATKPHSPAMASQQDSGFFEISIRSLLKSWGSLSVESALPVSMHHVKVIPSLCEIYEDCADGDIKYLK
ncbi:hypothetical protein DNTS_022195 [Danionella cerebrum]|uniref:Uncharacterized protein n=1 Tax=Danionella cerebrum TaxID=2873325 RepID=A0A553QLV5_9TELE|nr:hypothetical protein DNTS_022195 [Danionella translucida]